PADLVGADVALHQLPDLVERQSQLFERQNAIEARQLVGGVIAVARPPINMLRLEKIDIVVVSQQAPPKLGDLRDLTNFEHTSLATRAARRGGAPLRSSSTFHKRLSECGVSCWTR